MKRVSVIVPVYNVESYLDRCIESLVNQTYSDVEIILVNDGSTDNSGSIGERWSKVDNQRGITVKYIRQTNQGVSVARNTGLAEASGDYIMFVDSDDWCESDLIETMVNAITDAELGYCAYYLDTPKESTIVGNPFSQGKYSKATLYNALFFGGQNQKTKNMSAALWRGLFQKRIIDNNCIRFDPLLKYAEDWIFYAEYFKHIENISIVNKPLYHYCVRSGSAMTSFRKASQQGALKSLYILDKFFGIAEESQIPKNQYQVALANRYIGLILMQSKNVWDRRNDSSISQKRDFLRWICNEIDISERIDTMHLDKLDFYTRWLLYSIRKKRWLPISIHAIIYNFLRDTRNKMRQFVVKVRRKK